MKKAILPIAIAAAGATAQAQDAGLYYIGSDYQESLPLKWTVGADFVWDDNPTPTSGVLGDDEATSINPYVGLSFVNVTPQQTLDLYVRLGGVYYFDSPPTISDDFYGEAKLGLNWTRNISERLRFSSMNYVSYQLEPNYAYGFATTRLIDPYWFIQTDNSIGYRWTERFATYTGFKLTWLNYDSDVRYNDRFTWTVYQQFRYQFTPQTLGTFEYRYSATEGDGLASDSTSQYILAGIEHRFSPNTILVARAGAQIKESDAINGADTTAPYGELALNSAINEQFSVRAFARYGMEVYDTTRFVTGTGTVDFDDRSTLRIGVSGNYSFSPMFALFGGVDYIDSDFEDGRLVPADIPVSSSPSEHMINAYVGLSFEFVEGIYATVSYNYTDSSSDFQGYDYDRNRVSLGFRAEF